MLMEALEEDIGEDALDLIASGLEELELDGGDADIPSLVDGIELDDNELDEDEPALVEPNEDSNEPDSADEE
jgi:hypothetical protein